MCLARVDNFTPCRIGYKIMDRGRFGRLFGQYYTSSQERPLGVWLNARDYQEEHLKGAGTIESFTGSKYYAGWHTYHRKDSTVRHLNSIASLKCNRRCVIVQVAVRQAKDTGIQNLNGNDCRVTVSEQMMVLKVIAKVKKSRGVVTRTP